MCSLPPHIRIIINIPTRMAHLWPLVNLHWCVTITQSLWFKSGSLLVWYILWVLTNYNDVFAIIVSYRKKTFTALKILLKNPHLYGFFKNCKWKQERNIWIATHMHILLCLWETSPFSHCKADWSNVDGGWLLRMAASNSMEIRRFKRVLVHF